MVIPSLPSEYEQFVQGEVASGRFPTPLDVVCEALKQYREQQERLDTLKQEIQMGLDELRRGESIQIRNEAELDAYFDEIEARGRERLAKRTAS
jgi:antitoxin ParD1/3/4